MNSSYPRSDLPKNAILSFEYIYYAQCWLTRNFFSKLVLDDQVLQIESHFYLQTSPAIVKTSKILFGQVIPEQMPVFTTGSIVLIHNWLLREKDEFRVK